MRKIDLEELKKIQLNILDYVDNFCRNNDINYWLDCGTLLGAIRHKGYIPWDDDIDIGMLRSDYEKFINLFNRNNESNYKFHCYELDRKWYVPFGKVIDERTVLYEPDEKSGIKSSVNIDVFVYDNAPDNEKKLKKMFNNRDRLRKLNSLKTIKHFTVESKQKYNIFRYPIWFLFKIFPTGYFVKKMIDNSKKYMNVKTKNVGNFTSISKQVCSKSVFDSFVDIEFEGKKYKAPKGYDKWLTSFYGDYMKLPPLEKQISHHKFVAYKK